MPRKQPSQKLIQDISIGENLKRLRKQKGISQYKMAVLIQLSGRSMSRETYAHIEQGRGNIFVSDLLLFAKLLDADISEFFKGLTPHDRE